MLTHDEALRLQRDAPAELGRRALEERNEFVFGARDLREDLGRAWGGEARLFLNQNVVVHLVPRYNDEMRTVDELPQFSIFPDDDRQGEDRAHTYEGFKDLEPFEGVVFYVAPDEYRRILHELVGAFERYGDFSLLPDTLYAETAFVQLVTSRILEHPVVRAERSYDFSKRTF